MIRITPRSSRVRHIDQAVDGPGRLAATLLSVAAAGLMDQARFRRGKQLAGDDGVQSLSVDAGMLRANVQGSRSAPYEVSIYVPTVIEVPDVTDRSSMTRLAPQAADLDCTCTCPDGLEGPCKHVAAALLVFASEVSADAQLLAAWRHGEPSMPRRAKAGSRAQAAPHTPAPPADPFSSDEWQAWFGTGDIVEVVIPAAPLRRGREMFGTTDLGDWLHHAG